eukprot:5435493-Pleurochrysis_carterae.AAC.1
MVKPCSSKTEIKNVLKTDSSTSQNRHPTAPALLPAAQLDCRAREKYLQERSTCTREVSAREK